jgi:hypothetical protein
MRKVYLETRELICFSLEYEEIYFMLYVEHFIYELMKFIFHEMQNNIHLRIMIQT